jgi:hypothetical protein
MPEAAKPPAGEPDENGAQDPSTEAETEEPTFANRAERRAHARGKGKGAGHGHDHGKGGHLPGGRGSVQSPRQYGTRRSG